MTLATNQKVYWKFDESSGNATDAVGSLTATNNASTSYAAAKIGNGIDLESGSSNYFDVADNAAIRIKDGWSVSLWWKPESVSADQYIINQRTGENGIAIGLTAATGKLFIANAATSYSNVDTNYSISAGNWYHIVVYFNGTSTKVYVNNSAAQTISTNMQARSSATNTALVIGRKATSADNFCDGIIDELGIWDRELTAVDVSALYNNGNGIQYNYVTDLATTLLSYYKLDDDATDAQGTHNGTNHGADWVAAKLNNGASCVRANSDYIDLANFNGDGIKSISWWMKVDGATYAYDGNTPAFCSIVDGATSFFIVRIYDVAASREVTLTINKAGTQDTCSSAYTDATWQHWVATFDPDNGYLKLYRNGLKAAEDTTTSNTSFDINDVLRIAYDDFDGVYSDIVIDEVGIWTKGLTATEAASLYNSGDTMSYTAIMATKASTAYTATCSEILSLTDTISKSTKFNKSISETLSMTEAVSKSQGMSKSLTETLSLSDAISSAIQRGLLLLETLHITDTLQKTTRFAKTLTESISLTDTLASAKQFFVTLSETIGLTDVISKSTNFAKTLSETLHLTDVIKVTGWFWNYLFKRTSSYDYKSKSTNTWTYKDK